MASYFYVSKKINSLLRELSSDPSSCFSLMRSVLGYQACFNLTMVLYQHLDKVFDSHDWNLIRDTLNVLAVNFCNLIFLRFFK